MRKKHTLGEEHRKTRMHYITLLLAMSMSIFSTAVMSYISMATAIGPWIAPTITLLAMVILKIFACRKITERLALITVAGSVGGITATACGFSIPTLHFLHPHLFATWIASPFYFCIILAALVTLAGALGIMCADTLESSLIVQQEMPFPIGELIYKMISARESIRKSYELLIGFLGTLLFCVLQDGIRTCAGFIPKSLSLMSPFALGFLRIPLITFDVWPMVWAIGFVTGHVITVPLIVGALAKIVLVDPLQCFIFHHLSTTELTLAFCSGMIVVGVFSECITLPRSLLQGLPTTKTLTCYASTLMQMASAHAARWSILLVLSCLFLYWFATPLHVTFYLLVSSIACIYQVALMAGKIGIAPLGRFATFVMVPAMLLFGLDYVQLVLIAAFVEIACGVVADILFGRKLAFLMHIPSSTVQRYQWLGLIVSALSIGIFFWLLITRFGLGSTELFAQKAQNRQLLIHVKQFNYYVLLLGALFGYLLSRVKISPSLVLGGLLMPLNIVLGLIVGGLLSLCVRTRENWYPWWSGVFAANSLWMLIQALI